MNEYIYMYMYILLSEVYLQGRFLEVESLGRKVIASYVVLVGIT